MSRSGDSQPYEALVLLSFGGPERPEDVLPFLENVTRGRGIPRERLEAVGEHYHLFGGRSPINDLNRQLKAAIEADLAEHGIKLPVYWGNRNWEPYLADTVKEMAADGIGRALVFTTSAYSSYSSCRQYREDLAAAVEQVPGAPRLDRVRQYFNHPGFVEPFVDGCLEALESLSQGQRERVHLAFVTHSIPTSMNDTSGPEGHAYVIQHRSVMGMVLHELSQRSGIDFDAELVYCSRSGPPHMPWLEPDINEHLAAVAGRDEPATAVLIVPIGFVSDHMEVVYDLDTEAHATAERLGLSVRRVPTPGTDPRFVAMVRELLVERAAQERGESVNQVALGELGPWPAVCAVGCCPNARADKPALCGAQG